MSTPFSRTMRSLARDGFGRSIAGLLLAAALLGSWAAWLLLARITVYAVSETARLEVDQAVHPVETALVGRVVMTHLVVGKAVQAGDLLVELDAEAQRLQLEEERVRMAALSAQIEALRREVTGEEEARREERQAARMALDEARARHREAEVVARSAEDEAEVFTRLQARALPSQLDVQRAKAEAHKRRAGAEALRLAVNRLEGDQRTRESDRKARIERLKREVTRLEGEMATAAATIERLAHEIEKRRIRAPVAGHLGEVADLRVGTVVREGDTLGVVVPPGGLKIAAHFLPFAALGRIELGQSARLRLDGFPWTQYGSIAARVTSAANEARDGRIRVELTIHRDPSSPIPLQHGLPGRVEVEVDRTSPARLLLRAVGKRLDASTLTLWAGRSRGADR